MLTVGEALRRDRPILAVPGHPSTPSAAGTLDLICEGAIPLRDAQDVLVAIGQGGRRPRAVAVSDDRAALDPLERSILELLDGGPANLAELLQVTRAPMTEVSESLVRLEQGARIVRTGSWFEVRAPERRPAAT